MVSIIIYKEYEMSLPIPALTGANTISQLVADVNSIKLLAANTAGIVANSTFQAALANTNSYIATKTSTTTFNSALANTNAYIATKVNTTTFNSALANTNAYIATKVNTTTFNSALANTNAYIATKVNTTTFNSALANTNAYIAMKANTSNPIFNGIIGIGISPTRTLDVNGYAQIGSTAEGKLGIGEKLSTGAAHIELGEGRTGSGYAWIDLIGDTTYTDYGLRILRGNSGSNTTSNMWHRGTGDFNFVTQEAAPIIFYTNSTERMRLAANGNFGIGTSSPNVYGAGFVNLQINSTTGGIIQATYGGTTAIAEILTTSGEGRFGTRTNHPMILKTNNTERMRIDTSGNIHIGANASYPGKLTIVGINGEVVAGNTTDSLATFSDNGAASISVHSGSANTGTIYFGTTGAGGNTKGRLQYNHSSDAMIVYTDNTERMRLDSSGNVLIGTSTSDKQLTLYSATDASQGISLRNQSAGTSAASYISMGNDSDALDGQIFLTGSMNTSLAGTRSLNFLSNVGAFGFYRNRLSPVATMVMDTSGTVGIGATGNYTLTVGPQGGSGHSIVQLVNATTGTTAANGAYISVLGGQSDMRVWQQGNANILVGTNGAERMRITGAGLVGIGGAPTSSAGLETFQTNSSTNVFHRGDNHGLRFGFDASYAYIDAVTASISNYSPLVINALTSMNFRLNTATVVALATSGMTVTGTAVATQGMPIASQSANTKTLALTDNGSYVRCSNTTTMTVTIPANATVAFPTGAEMVFFQVGAGNVQFANAAGVTLNSKESLVNLTGQYSAATLKKIATNTWDLIGDLA
jgi:hypothetical protein